MPEPLVSCIMPTCDRRSFIKAAIDCWRKQTYSNLQLVIIDDGADRIRDLIPPDPRIIYVEMADRVSTGRKRNLCCEAAGGEIICHFDDDDWCDSRRIEKQVELLRESGQPVTGYSNIFYWNILSQEARLYAAQVKGYVCGGTLCYLKSWWKSHSFPDKQKASDNRVIYQNLKDIAACNDLGMYVARAHNSNVGGDKRSIGQLTSRDKLPAAFWENEALRLSCQQ